MCKVQDSALSPTQNAVSCGLRLFAYSDAEDWSQHKNERQHTNGIENDHSLTKEGMPPWRWLHKNTSPQMS